MLRNTLLAMAACGATFAAEAQEVYGLGGALQSGSDRTYSWEIDYHHQLGEYFVISGGWINEGHLREHHRDGGTAQLWARTRAFDRRLTLAAGIGPYVYFDTVPGTRPDTTQIDHGLGFVGSLAATYMLSGPWSIHLRANYISASGVDTTSVLLGVGYQVPGTEPPASGSSESSVLTLDREVTATMGTTFVNTYKSEDAFAAQIEYRQRVGSYFAWSVGILNEGDASTQRRTGATAQLWVGRSLFDQRVTAEVGIGPYVIFDIESNTPDDGSRERLAGIFSVALAYAPSPRWPLRFTWSRVFAQDSHDTDVFLLGAGYRF